MKKRSLFAVLTMTVFALTGCAGSGTVPEATGAAPPASTTATTTETTTPEETAAAPAPAGDLTAPGTQLKLGEAATLPLTSGDATGTISLTVTEIVPGSPSDLDELDLGDRAAGLTPYYIKYTATGVDESSKSLEHMSVYGDIDGLLADGSNAQSLTVIGKWSFCDSESFPGGFGPGVTVEGCVAWLAGEGASITGAAFSPYKGDYNRIEGQPVTWVQ